MVIDPKQTRDYTGETLDIRSRTHVRKELDRRMSMEPWNRWWVKGMNYVSRAKVAYELTEDLHQWWFGRNGEGYFRLTAFGSRETTKEACERIERLLKK